MKKASSVLQDSVGILKELVVPCNLDIQDWLAFKNSDDATVNHPILEGLLHKEEFLLLSATAKTGKTYLALELAKSVITGEPFLGEIGTTKGVVLYFETELKKSFLVDRFKKMLGNISDEDAINLKICKKSIKIDSEEGQLALAKAINQYKPDLVILDPFYRLHSKNEDKSQEITPILNTIKSYAQTYNVAFFVIHHEGKKGESNGNQTSHRPRGSSAFADVPDVIISMTRDSDKKACKLSIENRNFKGSQLLIKLKDDCSGWTVVSKSESDDVRIDLKSLFESVLINLMSKSELLLKLQDVTGLSERTCERKISSALDLKYIKKAQKNNSILYSLVKATTDSSYEVADVGSIQSNLGGGL